MISRLIERIRETQAPIVVGLDPTLAMIPPAILKDVFDEMGETPEAAAEAFFRFNRAIVDAVADLVPAVKPQIAMYEQLGVPGVAAFERTIRYCHEKGLIVIGDVKRGDIGSTSAAYAAGHLGSVTIGSRRYVPFGEDFATVNPYLGTDGIAPFLTVCREEDKGIFVLVKTSNPSSGELQDRDCEGMQVCERVARMVADWGRDLMDGAYSEVGAVVGATYPEAAKKLRGLMPETMILVPGYGAQGGKGKDLVPFFNADGLGAIVNSSRGITAAWKQEAYASFGADGFADAARAAVLAMKEDLRAAWDRT